MIDGVKIKKAEKHHDDRGFFAEIVKSGEETFHELKQTSYAEIYPGVIKAFHWHKTSWDIWCVVKGSAQVVLFDLREGSATKGRTDVLFVGEDNLVVIAIPPGVAHGYRVLGDKTMGIMYHTDVVYDPKNDDILKIPFDSPEIGFDWNIKNR